jgi:hypothetical protein
MADHHCCDSESCIRREVASLLEPDSPIIDRIYVAACAVAATCGELSQDELHACAAKMFELTPDCQLAKAFVIAYQTERDARGGRRDLERLKAALSK